MTSTSQRTVIAHIHLFKNAGTSVERALAGHFGDRWGSFDKAGSGQRIDQQELEAHLRDHPHLLAISSHQLRPPFAPSDGMRLLPVLFLRHPIDRIRSAYDFERTQGDVSPSSRAAASSTFPQWIEFHRGRGSTQCENFQTYALTSIRNDTNGAPLRKRPIAEHLASAEGFVQSLPVVGLVEHFDRSLARIADWLRHDFPAFDPAAQRTNATSPAGQPLAARLESVKAVLGDQAYQRLVEENAADLELHARARERFTHVAHED